MELSIIHLTIKHQLLVAAAHAFEIRDVRKMKLHHLRRILEVDIQHPEVEPNFASTKDCMEVALALGIYIILSSIQSIRFGVFFGHYYLLGRSGFVRLSSKLLNQKAL